MEQTSNNNPFYGLRCCLKLFQGSTMDISEKLLDNAWMEVQRDKQRRELFFSILFSIGDVTNRQHNIFKGKKVDNGGNANREAFYTIVTWLWKNHQEQFIKFLNAQLFNEYNCFDVLFRNRVRTYRVGKVMTIYSAFADPDYNQALLDYVYSIVKGNNSFNKMLVAKFLTVPRLSKRQGHNKLLEQTKHIMQWKAQFIMQLSHMMGWETKYFKGYRDWRKQYNGNLESVLFSTGKINEFSKEEFLDWFNKLPALARTRVMSRVTNSEKEDGSRKWKKFYDWIREWKLQKEKAQAEKRLLEEKIRQGQADEEDLAKLEEVKKEAKVTVGATNFQDLYDDILHNKIDELKLESFMDKINLPYNSLVIVDDSGSMSGAPFNFAKFIAATCLIKNPDDDGRNLLGFFNDHTHWHCFMDRKSRSRNSILLPEFCKTEVKPFVDPLLSFYDNYKNIASFMQSVFQSGCTYIDRIPEGLKQACDNNPQLLDMLKAYPVWTLVSDGEFNSLPSPEASMNDFMRRCEMYFGYKPYIVAIDICENTYARESLKIDRFTGIDNMIYIPSNPAMIELLLTNFKDLEKFDIYTSLLSLYRSNRYELVRQNVI